MDSFIIIGTAGHVDHGKTQLVKALTGVDTDRLKEEQERGISIELGFAPLYLNNGMVAGIVDVPGHERFVKNMLAGAAGVDLVLFVVAADEGVMPQTREHLDILELLHVQQGIVALTKTDLVDQDWLQLVKEEVRELLAGTRFADAPIVSVSSVTGEGLEELRRILEQMAATVQPKPWTGPARLPIDRIFTITGFGTVLTGTLFSGSICLGDMLAIMPSEVQGRVRSLQVHGKKTEDAHAGQRVAVNLAGVEVSEVERGEVLVTSGAFIPVHRLTTWLHILERAPHHLKNWQRVRFHLGTKETLGRLRLLNHDELLPGDDAFVQIELEEPVVAAVHDRFVIRQYSPVTTIGGGEIVEVGGLRHRRFRSEVLARLERKLSGSPFARLGEELQTVRGPVTPGDLAGKAGLTAAEVRQFLEEMRDAGDLFLFDLGSETYAVTASLIASWEQAVEAALRQYHRQFPLRNGYPKEELRSRIFSAIPPRLYQALLDKWVLDRKLALTGQTLAWSGFSVQLTPQQQGALEKALSTLQAQPFTPPPLEELRVLLGDPELLQYCLQQEILVKVGEEFYFLKEGVGQAWQVLRSFMQEHGEVTVAEVRNLLGTSRRYCLPLLEYFDQTKKTKRLGDKRKLF
ncbi:MAG: selenocysteine-specific translation elongation factor [Thermacetogeniaceae bacterium]